MGLRQREWARKAYDTLVWELGAQCANCKRTRKLELDCIIPQGDFHHRAMGWSWRVSFYRAQHREGNLQVLCKFCNAAKGDKLPF